MDYRKVNHFSIILALIAASLSLIVSLGGGTELFDALLRAVVSFLIIWIMSQLVSILIFALIFRVQEEVKDEKKRVLIEDQKRKIQLNEEHAVHKISSEFKMIADKIDEKIEQSKTRLKGNNTDVVVDD